MGIKISKLYNPAILGAVIIAGIVAIGGFGIAQQVQAAQTPANYCNKYPPDSGDMYMRSACYDGLKIADGRGEGASCQDYLVLADQATVEVCQTALMERTATKTGSADIVAESKPEDRDEPVEPEKTPTKTPPKGSSGPSQDDLDETKSLSEYLDVLHKSGDFKDIDLNSKQDRYGRYINGAGEEQEIHVDPSGNKNSPAIIIINGGGWHYNDQNDDYIRENKPDKTHGATQVGPTAKQRGYTVFELTFRLGSSGVYYMFEDVMRGIKHIREHAQWYDIDPSKIALWGDSSSGSLAVRAGASGKSGVKVVAGWSPPTNAYTGLFRSYKSLFIGMDHSTCIPTDLAGLTNITDLITGGSGKVAEYGLGLSSNDFTSLGIGGESGEPDMFSTLIQVFTAQQYAMQTSQNIEVISGQLEAAWNDGKPTIGSISGSGLASGIINMSPKKLIECIDNFNALSPALFASPDTPPMVLAGFYEDDVVDPNQITGMHEKLQTLGIKSEHHLLHGDPNLGKEMFGPNPGNHLDYDARFVCPTLNFIDSVIQPDRSPTNCDTGQTENLGSAEGARSGSGEGGGTGGGGGQNSNSGQNNNPTNSGEAKAACDSEGYQVPGVSGVCPKGQRPGTSNCPAPGPGGTGAPLSDFCKGGNTNNGCEAKNTCQNIGGFLVNRDCSKEINGQCGNFNPNIKLDTSTTSVSPDPCKGRGGFMMGPDGAKAKPPSNGKLYPNNAGYKYVCYGGEW